VGAQLIKHGVVVAVACREVEHELGREPESGHARVVDRAAKEVAARGSGQGGARLVEHPGEPGIVLEFGVEPARCLRCQVLGGRQAAFHRSGPRPRWCGELGVDAVEQLVVGVTEGGDAFTLELGRDPRQVDALGCGGGERTFGGCRVESER